MSNPNFKDISNLQYGKLFVLYRVDNNDRGDAQWKCACLCGEFPIIIGSSMRRGHTLSCGCLQREETSNNPKHITHGLSHTREFKIWVGIKKRCNPALQDKGEHYLYSGRGITICDGWKESFENFYRDMRQCPTDKHSIERIDNSKGYSPNNCKWATPKEQANNKRNNIYIEYRGKTQTLMQWAEELNIDYKLVLGRYRAGWSIEDIFNKPKRVWN